jgi:hypothetical protein
MTLYVLNLLMMVVLSKLRRFDRELTPGSVSESIGNLTEQGSVNESFSLV